MMAEVRPWQSPLALSQAPETELILGELRALRDQVPVDPGVCVAIVDGPVDLSHPCFRGARLRRIDTLVDDLAGTGAMSEHGTHVASVVFGQPFSGTLGLAPGCQGLVAPVFRDSGGHLSQLDLARAIERAVSEGANVVNVSGGQLVEHGQPDPLLARAVDLCEKSGVVVVAATGNDSCDCVHVPAALPTVLAVGALARNGTPVSSSNFGGAYTSHGVLAPGEQIPGAVPGGAIALKTGSSFATPIVSALAALLLCEQRRLTGAVDIAAVRRAILASAHPCRGGGNDLVRCLAGILNVRGAHALITEGGKVTENDAMLSPYVAGPGGATARPLAGVVASGAPSADSGPPTPPPIDPGPPPSMTAPAAAMAAPAPEAPVMPTAATPATAMPTPAMSTAAPMPAWAVQAWPTPTTATYAVGPSYAPTATPTPGMFTAAPPPAWPGPTTATAAVGPSSAPAGGQPCTCGTRGQPESVQHALTPSGDAPQAPAVVTVPAKTLVYAIGNIGFDFGTEARRDTFRQLMPNATRLDLSPPESSPPNPYDTTQLFEYLNANHSESTKLIWTFLLDAQPVYGIEAELPYADAVYSKLRLALKNQPQPADDPDFVSRVSLPGVLTTRTVRLFSGQVIPVVTAQARGLFLWNEATLVDAAVAAVNPTSIGADPDTVALKVRQMLDKVYYQLRNLGTSSPDRAINFMATNAFQFTQAIAQGILSASLVDGDVTSLYSLDSISAVKSPFCRIDSDCWDVQITFFNPENDQTANVVLQTTVDVSDEFPVQLAPTHQYLV